MSLLKIFPGFAHLVNRLDPLSSKVFLTMCARMNDRNEIYLNKDMEEICIRSDVSESEVYIALDSLRNYPEIGPNEVIGKPYAGPLVQKSGSKYIINPCFAHKFKAKNREELIADYFALYEDTNPAIAAEPLPDYQINKKD